MRRSVAKGINLRVTLRITLRKNEKDGGVSEWSKEHAWKVCKSKGFEGSNPSPSAKNLD